MAYSLTTPIYSGTDIGAGTVNGSAVEVWEFDGNSWVAILSCTLKSGSGALDVKFQTRVPGTATWVDVGVAFAQKSATGTEAKVVTLPAICRAVVTVGGTAVYDVNVWASGRAVN